MARQVHTRQRSFDFKGWGGRRKGAGRPRKPGAKVRHAPRASLAPRYPAQVTLRTVAGAPNLRRGAVYAAIEAAIRAVNERAGFRVVHFTAQTNHLHAIVEASAT